RRAGAEAHSGRRAPDAPREAVGSGATRGTHVRRRLRRGPHASTAAPPRARLPRDGIRRVGAARRRERLGRRVAGRGAAFREPPAAGIEIGSRGATHRALSGLSDADLELEIAGSKERLQNVIGAPVVTFCYPFGAFDDRVVEAVMKAGYRAATVIRGGIPRD